MNRFSELRKHYSLKTEITASEYNEAKSNLPEKEFELHYLREFMSDPTTGTERPRYYHLEFVLEDAELLLLDQIQRNTADSARYLKYIWTFIVVNICIAAAILLIAIFAQ